MSAPQRSILKVSGASSANTAPKRVRFVLEPTFIGHSEVEDSQDSEFEQSQGSTPERFERFEQLEQLRNPRENVERVKPRRRGSLVVRALNKIGRHL